MIGDTLLSATKLQWTLSYLTSSQSILPVIEAIQNGNAACVSDDYYFYMGKVGAVEMNHLGSREVKSFLEPIDHNSYRSELGDLVAIIAVLQCLELHERSCYDSM